MNSYEIKDRAGILWHGSTVEVIDNKVYTGLGVQFVKVRVVNNLISKLDRDRKQILLQNGSIGHQMCETCTMDKVYLAKVGEVGFIDLVSVGQETDLHRKLCERI